MIQPKITPEVFDLFKKMSVTKGRGFDQLTKDARYEVQLNFRSEYVVDRVSASKYRNSPGLSQLLDNADDEALYRLLEWIFRLLSGDEIIMEQAERYCDEQLKRQVSEA